MARSAKQNRDARERSQQSILDAAFEVFGERGYHEASLAEIARRAGVAQGLVSYYFGGKEQLIGAVLDRWFARFLSVGSSEDAPDDRLRRMIDETLLAAASDLATQRIILGQSILPSTHHIFVDSESRNIEAIERAEDWLRDLFAQRGAEHPALEEVMFRSTLEGIVVKLCIYGDAYPLQGARRWVYDIYGLGEPSEPLDYRADAAEVRLRATTR